MNTNELIDALKRLKVETGSLACTGCGYEHDCGVKGCAIMREAAEEIEQMQKTQLSGMDMLAIYSALDMLGKYQEAEKDGRLVVLPCKSGQHVFALFDDKKQAEECEVEHAILDGWRKAFAIRPTKNHHAGYYAPFGAFGQTVFLTRAEAEHALEAKQEDGDAT